MKHHLIREEYYIQTGRASDVLRQLSYAGFAAIWVFRTGSDQSIVPGALLPAALFFAFALFPDLLQYVCAASGWSNCNFEADRLNIDDNEEHEVSSDSHKTPMMFFRYKMAETTRRAPSKLNSFVDAGS